MFNSYHLAVTKSHLSFFSSHLAKFPSLSNTRKNYHHKSAVTEKEIMIRPMDRQDLQRVLTWAEQEGWNPGRHEADALYAVDPEGYHLLEVNGLPVASLAGVKYSAHFAFLGLYIVKPEYRGLGYGKLLWDKVLDRIKDCDAVGLNGVIEQAPQYEKEGFAVAHDNTRWQGYSLASATTYPLKKISSISINQPTFLTPVIDYDAKSFPASRINFMSKWLTMPDSYVLTANDGDKLCGYGVISKSTAGYKIAPLLADNQEIAEHLYQALCDRVPNQGAIQLDTPANNPQALVLARQFGLQKTFNTLRMYKGAIKPLEDYKQFGLTTLEIG